MTSTRTETLVQRRPRYWILAAVAVATFSLAAATIANSEPRSGPELESVTVGTLAEQDVRREDHKALGTTTTPGTADAWSVLQDPTPAVSALIQSGDYSHDPYEGMRDLTPVVLAAMEAHAASAQPGR